MAQINLLKQTSPSLELWQIIPKFIVRVLVVVFILLIVYYGWLFFSDSRINQQILTTQQTAKEAKQKAIDMPGRRELLVRQQQLKNFNELVATHVYWSQLLPKIAKATYNKATYSSLKVAANGDLTLSVNVPDLSDMDRYLQVFDLPEVNKYFSQVRIGTYHKVQGKTTTTISFEVNMQFAQNIISTPPAIQ